MIAWEIARTSAFVAFACYSVTIAWGLCLAGRAFRPPVGGDLGYHRFVARIGALALVVHVATVVAVHANGVQPATLVVVRAAPAAVAGVTATWLALLLPLSYALRRRDRLSHQAWRALHYVGYVVWPLALLHALGAGTDSRAPAALAIYGAGAGIVAAAACWRALARRAPARAPRPAASSSTEAP